MASKGRKRAPARWTLPGAGDRFDGMMSSVTENVVCPIYHQSQR